MWYFVEYSFSEFYFDRGVGGETRPRSRYVCCIVMLVTSRRIAFSYL